MTALLALQEILDSTEQVMEPLGVVLPQIEPLLIGAFLVKLADVHGPVDLFLGGDRVVSLLPKVGNDRAQFVDGHASPCHTTEATA